MTASKVPGGAEGCFGSIWNLTRPLVAFSTSLAQPCKTTAVRWCCGDTHDDMVSVVWATAGWATAMKLAASAVSARVLRLDIIVLRSWGG